MLVAQFSVGFPATKADGPVPAGGGAAGMAKRIAVGKGFRSLFRAGFAGNVIDARMRAIRLRFQIGVACMMLPDVGMRPVVRAAAIALQAVRHTSDSTKNNATASRTRGVFPV